MKQANLTENLFECIASTMTTEPGRGRRPTMVQSEHQEESKIRRILPAI